MTTDATPDVQPPVDWRKRYAFGLPSGSIRALLALAIFALMWMWLIVQPTHEIPDYLRDLLFIIMGHYFASRHKAASTTESGPPPLWLPSGSVRLFLVLGSIVVAIVLFKDGTLADPVRNPGVVTLLMVGGFLLGVVTNSLYSRWKSRGHTSPRIVEDLRAGVPLIAAIGLILLVANRVFHSTPPDQIEAMFPAWLRFGKLGVENLLAAIVGFYFGSRS